MTFPGLRAAVNADCTAGQALCAAGQQRAGRGILLINPCFNVLRRI